MDRKEEKMRLEKDINTLVPVSFQWPTTDDFEPGDTDNLSILVKFLHTKCSHTIRAVWKTIVKEKIELHFTDTIFREDIKIEGKYFDVIIRKLQELFQIKGSQFAYKPIRRNLTIQVIFSDKSVLTILSELVSTTNKTEDRVTLLLPEKVYTRYQALDEEGMLNALQEEAPNTRFTVTGEGNVKLTGPKSEVERSKTAIMELAVHTTEIHKHLSIGQEKVLKTMDGRLCLQEKLRKEKLCGQYKVDESFCKLWVYYTTQEEVKQKADVLSKLVQSVMYEKKIQISTEMQTAAERNRLDSFIRQFTASVYMEVDYEKHEVKISGIENCVKGIEAHLHNFLNEQPLITTTVVLPLDVMEYIVSYSETFKTTPFRTLRRNHDSGKSLPVEVQIKATEKETMKLRDSLLQEAKMIKTHWFYVSRPWLAVERNEVMDIIESMTEENKCTIALDTSASLITDNVGCFALQQIIGTLCFSACCDLAKRVVDVIVVPVSDGSLQLTSEFTKSIASKGKCTYVPDSNENCTLNPHSHSKIFWHILKYCCMIKKYGWK